LPQTEALATRILTLPLYGGLSDEQVETVIEALLDVIQTL
jgi:dTDP-4-amino-4,6-dideoxygalactose transaminase